MTRHFTNEAEIWYTTLYLPMARFLSQTSHWSMNNVALAGTETPNLIKIWNVWHANIKPMCAVPHQFSPLTINIQHSSEWCTKFNAAAQLHQTFDYQLTSKPFLCQLIGEGLMTGEGLV